MGRRKKPIEFTVRSSTILLDGTLRPNYPVSPPQPCKKRRRISSRVRAEASNSATVSDQPHPLIHEEAGCNELSGNYPHSEQVGHFEEDRKTMISSGSASQRREQKGSSSDKKRKAAGLAGGVSKVPEGAGKQTSTAEKPKDSCETKVPDKLPLCGAQEQSRSARAVDEIDYLFASAKKGKAAIAQQQSGEQAGASKAAVKGSRDDIFGNGLHKGRRRTEEGYAIYLEEEMNLNRGGDTPFCPFDCDCCF